VHSVEIVVIYAQNTIKVDSGYVNEQDRMCSNICPQYYVDCGTMHGM